MWSIERRILVFESDVPFKMDVRQARDVNIAQIRNFDMYPNRLHRPFRFNINMKSYLLYHTFPIAITWYAGQTVRIMKSVVIRLSDCAVEWIGSDWIYK